MKAKISTTIEASLLRFLDSLPGDNRSEKLERILARFKQVSEEKELRRKLVAFREDDEERLERELWERTMAEAMWTE
jgi:hypothetical protein